MTTQTHRRRAAPSAPDTTIVLGWTVPVWLLRTLSVLVAVGLAVAVYVMVTEAQDARADAQYRACQVDALSRSNTVDRTLDVLIRVNIDLQTAAPADQRAIRARTVADLDRIARDRAQSRAESEAACPPPPR